MMQIPIVIQARMSSFRLPGKVLQRVRNKPLLEYLVERVRLSQLSDGIIVATSSEPSDDPIADYCVGRNLECFRGSLVSVAERFMEVVKAYDLQGFVRVCADRPWQDPRLIDEALKIYKRGKYDIVTNCYHKTFPRGQSVEIISSEAFLRGYSKMRDAEDLEHVTRYFYYHPDEFNIRNIQLPSEDFSSVNLCVDTEPDFKRFEAHVEDLQDQHQSLSWRQVTKLYTS